MLPPPPLCGTDGVAAVYSYSGEALPRASGFLVSHPQRRQLLKGNDFFLPRSTFIPAVPCFLREFLLL